MNKGATPNCSGHESPMLCLKFQLFAKCSAFCSCVKAISFAAPPTRPTDSQLFARGNRWGGIRPQKIHCLPNHGAWVPHPNQRVHGNFMPASYDTYEKCGFIDLCQKWEHTRFLTCQSQNVKVAQKSPVSVRFRGRNQGSLGNWPHTT